MLEFLCPNGHKIHCADANTGRAAKCPRCGVKFRIPTLTDVAIFEEEASAATAGDVVSPSPPADDPGEPAPVQNPTAEGPAQTAAEIDFLCPNGHALHGPADLQGQLGECPECDARFRIPLVDAPAQGDESYEVLHAGAATHVADDQLAIATTMLQAAATASPMAELFAQLWALRGESGRVELHLADGEILVPQGFAPVLSAHDHAVFAVEQADGRHTVVAIPWATIVRMEIKDIAALPPEMTP